MENVSPPAVAAHLRVVAAFDRRLLRRTTVLIVVVTACLISVTNIAASASDRRAGLTWRGGVTSICAGALLFDGRHSIGTEQGAVAVARDIRASTARRLARIGALRAQPEWPLLARQWLRLERRLSELYASSYLSIWHAIASANNPAQRARLPQIVESLLQRPDVPSAHAQRLEGRLQVPDCTGGENPNPDPSASFSP